MLNDYKIKLNNNQFLVFFDNFLFFMYILLMMEWEKEKERKERKWITSKIIIICNFMSYIIIKINVWC